MLEFILASNNAHKAQELNELLTAGNLSIVSASKKLEVDETGDTFQENAFIKAQAYFDEYQKPTLADDSGLVVPSMPEILGVQSARFMPELSDYKDKNQKLLELMQAKQGKEREAYFACYLCFYLSPAEVYFFEGRVHGEIGPKAQGEDGFGYDPIFYPTGQEGKSLAQVHEWKMQNSHRAKACREAVNFFKGQK
jgi:XTP/dITP diphosphohydrolase